MTFKVTVFEVVLPFLGVTVTVTLHDPALRPLSDEPETLQYFAELAATFSDTFDVEATVSLEYLAIETAEVDLVSVTFGMISRGVFVVIGCVEVVVAGATVGAMINTFGNVIFLLFFTVWVTVPTVSFEFQ